jgi:hypothetical protein
VYRNCKICNLTIEKKSGEDTRYLNGEISQRELSQVTVMVHC